ncbi:metallophosphoesterase family protein [Miniphocaeibacter massiliensis]|uniref:metallophosphoesterase family protein n=1 Tax=Miniphocaeibacter massiliensis TaxID=2041841 RepID=UPI000C07F96E|nr:metallophosphoesterase [Miniphocaeibacter massiliensis]
MKFLFFTDTHIRATNPVSRLDNYLETTKNKFLEVKDIIESNNIDFVLHGGDFFDRPDVPVKIVGEFANILKSFNVPIYMISGNHDIFGHNPITIERSMLGLLDTLGIVNIIEKDKPIILERNNLKIQISGCPYVYDIDSEYKNYYFPEKLNDVDYHIFMIHSFLLDKPFLDTISHTLIDEVSDVDADIILSGHYHTGFGVKKVNNKYFINPGSLLRTNSSKPERARIPEVIILDLSKKNILIEEIKLKTAKPGEEVLDINSNIEKIGSEALEEFKLLVRQNAVLENYNVYEILKEISNKNNFPTSILEEALKRLEEVEGNVN